MSSYSLTRSRTIQYVGILLALITIAAGYWYFTVRAGVKTNSGASQPQGTGDLSASLAGYWKLDENTGTSAADASTNGVAGTLINGPTWGTGQIGSAVNFDGTNDYVNAGTSAKYNFTGDFSVTAWYKTAAAGTKVIMGRASTQYFLDAGEPGYYLVVRNGTGGNIEFNAAGASANVDLFGSNVEDNNWHHAVGVRSGNVFSLYSDGVLVDSDTVAVGSMSTAGQTLYIGNDSGGDAFSGTIDEARVYDRALSPDDIAKLYRLTTPTGVDTSLKGYWSFNGDALSGTTAYDRSGAGNTGTLTNGPTVTEGRIGQGINFDGTNDNADIGGGADLIGTGNVTLCTWINPTAVDTATYQSFISNGRTQFQIYATGSQLNFTSNSSGGNGLFSTEGSITAGKWQHVCGTRASGANGPGSIYIDGVLNSSGNTLTPAAGFYTLLGSDSGGYYYGGKMDEVRQYNRILSAAEIKSLYDLSAPDKTNTAAAQPAGTGTLASGLTAYFPLDENTGTSAADASTNAITSLTLTNGPTWTTGQIGSAIDFDGTNDYATTPDTATLDFVDGETFTVSGWFNRDTFTTPDQIFAKQINAFDAGYGMYIDTTDQIYFNVYDGTDLYSLETAAGFIVASGWHHFSAVWGDTTAALYIDGALVSTTPAGTIGNIGSLANANPFRIGASSDGSQPFDGKLDEIRVYDRVLSPDEVGQLYRLTSPTGTDTSLKGYWSFNGQDISGTTAYDRSGTGNNGTLTNGPTTKWGRVGQALQFDGTNDSVTIADSSIVEPANPTLTAWFKATSPQISTTYGGIIAKAETSGYFIEIDIDGTDCGTAGNLCGGFYIGGAYRLVDTPVSFGDWHNVALTYNGSVVTLYLDGVLVDTTSISGSITYNTEPLCIGADATSGTCSEYFFTGAIDEVRVYNRVLSAAEIKAQYDLGQSDKTNTSASQPQGTGNLDSGLAGYWKLDDGTSGATPTSAVDTSTGGNNGTLENGPTWTTGRIGSAVQFDGTNDDIDAGTIPGLTGATDTPFSFAFWVNTSAGEADEMIGWGPYRRCRPVNIAVTYGVGCTVNGDEYAGGAYSTSQVNDGQWHHIIYTHDAGNQKLYFDGRLEGTASQAFSTGSDGIMLATRPFGGYFNGKLDEVRVYNRVLSADEAAALYRLATPTGTDTSLKGYWSFNGQDMNATTAFDRSGTGNNGTLTNGATTKWGRVGQALNLDGTNDYVAIADPGTGSTLDFATGTSITISTWIYPTAFNDYGVILTKGANAVSGTDVNYGLQYLASCTTACSLSFFYYNGTSGWNTYDTAQAVISKNEWQHISFTYTVGTANSAKMYRNGVLVSGSWTAGNGNDSPTLSNSPIWIGADDPNFDATPDELFTGKIDEARIYNRILSAAEVLSLYNQSR